MNYLHKYKFKSLKHNCPHISNNYSLLEIHPIDVVIAVRTSYEFTGGNRYYLQK